MYIVAKDELKQTSVIRQTRANLSLNTVLFLHVNLRGNRK